MTRRLVAALGAMLLMFVFVGSPSRASADWLPISYRFCNDQYTQDELQYVSEPILSAYNVDLQGSGVFTITPTNTFDTEVSKWTVDKNGFATIPLVFTKVGHYLVFFGYTPFIFDDAYFNVTSDGASFTTRVNTPFAQAFKPAGVYTPFSVQVTDKDGTGLAGVDVSFPGWAPDANPYVATTDSSGYVHLYCVGKMRNVLSSGYALPNLLNIFVDDARGSYCGFVTWGIDATDILVKIKATPGGCTDLPTSSRSVSTRRR